LTPIAFEDAIARTADRRRHLLLGNGFSIAAWPGFGYGALVGTVAGQAPRIEALFDRFQTVDFERVARALIETRTVLGVHTGTEAVDRAVSDDYADLRRLLVSAITRIHPPTPAALAAGFYPCADFLARFIGADRPEALRGRVFSTSYDLLLYWTLMRRGEPLVFNDGFHGRPLRWEISSVQSIFYLHGALHLFEADGVTQKLSVRDRLVQTIARRIQQRDVPLFISEGSSREKRVRIEESPYLKAASDCLAAACDDPEASLFVFGHSLRDEDAHIFEKVVEGDVAEVFVSVRPQDSAEGLAQIRAAAELWVEKRARRGGPPLTVFRYDPAEAAPWG